MSSPDTQRKTNAEPTWIQRNDVKSMSYMISILTLFIISKFSELEKCILTMSNNRKDSIYSLGLMYCSIEGMYLQLYKSVRMIRQ